jgi:hypothetical protein
MNLKSSWKVCQSVLAGQIHDNGKWRKLGERESIRFLVAWAP